VPLHFAGGGGRGHIRRFSAAKTRIRARGVLPAGIFVWNRLDGAVRALHLRSWFRLKIALGSGPLRWPRRSFLAPVMALWRVRLSSDSINSLIFPFLACWPLSWRAVQRWLGGGPRDWLAQWLRPLSMGPWTSGTKASLPAVPSPYPTGWRTRWGRSWRRCFTRGGDPTSGCWNGRADLRIEISGGSLSNRVR
jgi:hypothetical protein